MQIVCDIDIINLIKNILNDHSGIILNMNIFDKKYFVLLQDNGADNVIIKVNYKPYLKQ